MVAALSARDNWGLHAAAAVATLAGLWAAYNCGKAASRRHQKVFVLSVTLAFPSEAELEAFLTVWRPLAEYVKRNEPRTLSFELCHADNDPLKIMVYERYVSKSDYTEVHRSSGPMRAFKEATAGMKFTVTGQSFYESNIGYM
ncbi:hypothetical protein Rsub_04637 [Raphidocelis subcapitata]|uniref:ABM domain-containing protein n=1 Tax=Raphidocelis subcapitata TaxID=307507 RepID=A0A2V0P247_9CHLO|nr:hypothetical protein Rsub_04637 [Raphidocelis subcapitata]|eukprot:GBF91913.1 hypothetical protein Rsub_04637 [Raphidocelis subcapitata]